MRGGGEVRLRGRAARLLPLVELCNNRPGLPNRLVALGGGLLVRLLGLGPRLADPITVPVVEPSVVSILIHGVFVYRSLRLSNARQPGRIP